MSTVFTVERSDHVATIWMDNVPRRNAMGRPFFADLPALMTELTDDTAVRVVIIAAKGPDFTIGLDLKEMGGVVTAAGEAAASAGARNTAAYRSIRRLQASITAVAECPKPVIAAVHGWCIGGGIDLITACDIRVASADAQFSVRETKVAIVADLGTLQRLPGIIGRGHVAELTLTGKDITAERASAIGLVNDVLPDQSAAYSAAHAMATEIAANSPIVVQGVKHLLASADGQTVEKGLDDVAIWNSAFLVTDDLKEAMTAFREKRPPEYRGT